MGPKFLRTKTSQQADNIPRDLKKTKKIFTLLFHPAFAFCRFMCYTLTYIL